MAAFTSLALGIASIPLAVLSAYLVGSDWGFLAAFGVAIAMGLAAAATASKTLERPQASHRDVAKAGSAIGGAIALVAFLLLALLFWIGTQVSA